MKYIDVYSDIKYKILNGEYSSWTSLDGEEILAIKYGVSRPTVRKAISKLKGEGYVHSRQGSGIFVNPPEFYEHTSLTTLSEKENANKKIQNFIIKCEDIKADEELSKVFNISLGEDLIHYIRLREISNSTRIIEETFMPRYLFKSFTMEVLEKSVLKFIENQSGYNISHDIKTIKAIKINKQMAELFQLEEDSPLLQVEHKVYLTKSIMAQFTKEISTNNQITIASVR